MACNLVVFSNIAKYLFVVFNNLNVPPLLTILWYVQKLYNIGWLQQLNFFPVACNLVVFSNIANNVEASIILTKYFGGFNNLKISPVACNLVVFSNIATVAGNLVVFSNHKILGGFNNLNFQSCGIFKHCHIFGGFHT